MCYFYTPDYNGCHNCQYSHTGLTTGRTYKCDNPLSIWSSERRLERTQYKLGNLPCDHTCELFKERNKHIVTNIFNLSFILYRYNL